MLILALFRIDYLCGLFFDSHNNMRWLKAF